MFKELTNEQKTVILTSRLTFNTEDEENLNCLLKEELDWYEIFRIATKNKVVSLIWFNLHNRGYSDKIPSNLERIMYFYYLGTKYRNKSCLDNMKDILLKIEEKGVQCVPLKGGELIPELYKDLGIRSINDIDLMLKYSDTSSIRSIMNELGYIEGDYDESTNSIIKIGREKRILWKNKMNNLFPFKKITNSEYVHIFEFDFCFSLDLDLNNDPVNLMVSRANKENKYGHLSLRPSDFFIHLCCHLYKEATNAMWVIIGKDLNLIKFCDVREFFLNKLSKQDIREAIEFSKRYGLEKAVYFTLYYLKEIYNDGYEIELMEQLSIEDNEFINTFGNKDYGKDLEWKKDFWQRLFSNDNKDELQELPRYLYME
ncbi:nucleotidyltransferase family protein [Clostridium tertium]|uniref:nucleotidyltransferase family protein n=1 Tax=Clostridium tertium TaxID=1559 RepID=UPI0024B3A24D|nr:nucleotidyltransferase family protein [Clostridium tertium]MDI9216427.1 nucleotidyltransferase family protein [Clostridium tertium]